MNRVFENIVHLCERWFMLVSQPTAQIYNSLQWFQNIKLCYTFTLFQIDEDMQFKTTEYIDIIHISWKLYLINEQPHLIQNDFWSFSFNDVHVHGTNYLSIMFGAYQNKVLMLECSCEQTSCSRTYFSLSSAFLPWRQ